MPTALWLWDQIARAVLDAPQKEAGDGLYSGPGAKERYHDAIQ